MRLPMPPPSASPGIPHHLDASEAAARIQIPLQRWAGNCYTIATAFVTHGLVPGAAVYGHWLGPVHPHSYFCSRHGLPFVQHGWVELPDGRVCDPTRWAFTAEAPYVYIGPNGGDYDEGGTAWRKANLRPIPAPDPTDAPVELSSLPDLERAALIALAGGQPRVTIPIVFWIANLPLDAFGAWLLPAYRAISRLALIAFTPLDYRLRIEREHGPLPSPTDPHDPVGTALQRWLHAQPDSDDPVRCAARLGLPLAHLHAYRAGTRIPTYRTLQALRSRTGCDLNELFDAD